jgi:hypothetical protein
MFGFPEVSAVPQSNTKSIIEAALLSVFNVIAVYIAAFVFRLSWMGVATVMIISSIFTAFITNVILMKIKLPFNVGDTQSNHTMLISFVASLFILSLLGHRFNYPMSLGIALLAGSLSTYLRSLMGSL